MSKFLVIVENQQGAQAHYVVKARNRWSASTYVKNELIDDDYVIIGVHDVQGEYVA